MATAMNPLGDAFRAEMRSRNRAGRDILKHSGGALNRRLNPLLPKTARKKSRLMAMVVNAAVGAESISYRYSRAFPRNTYPP